MKFKYKSLGRYTRFVILGVVAFISILFFFCGMETSSKFYLLPARLFEFAIGGILALTYDSTKSDPLGKFFIYVCYAFLLALMTIESDYIPANARLCLVVAITGVLICSQNTLENNITGNKYLAKLGAASYSIFIWHQIVFAFYRSCITAEFNCFGFLFCIVVTALLSWLTYSCVEQKIPQGIKERKKRRQLIVFYGFLFVALNIFTLLVYKNAGVVRDIPELEVSKSNPRRGMWSQYNSRVYDWDRPFVSDKPHWLVIGNSFGRDFCNIIEESCLSSDVEVSYCVIDGDNYKKTIYDERYLTADKIFISALGLTEERVHEIEIRALAFGHTLDDVIIVGEKYFGEAMSQVYCRRYRENYFNTTIPVKDEVLRKNNHFKELYGKRFLDLLPLVTNEEGRVIVFTDENLFFSHDCTHLTRGGAAFFGRMIDLKEYLK